MRNPEPNHNGTVSFFVDLVAGMLHDGGLNLGRVLKANHGSENGIAEHILTCPLCQRRTKRKATR
jgi:hypothetical protein